MKTSLAGSHVTPDTWAWTNALDPVVLVSDKGKKVKTKDVLESGEFPVVDQGKVLIRGYCNDPSKVISLDSPVVVFGDHTRETKFVDFDFVVGADGVKILQPIMVDARYYFLAIQWLPIESRGYGRHFKILRESLLPLPPLAEQHRIVAKVDELMALCDELEAAQAKREDRRDRLVAATLHGLNNGDTEPGTGTALDFTQSARFYLNHFPRLTTRPEHVHQLRQTILNLAVRGKLVEQDPDDEPAEELLKRIGKEKAQLLREGKIKKQSQSAKTNETINHPFLPQNWEMASLQALCISIADGDHQPPPRADEGVPFLVIGNVRWHAIDFSDCRYVTEEYFKSLDPVRKPMKGDILYTLVGSFGIPVPVVDDRPFCIQRHIGILRPAEQLETRYLVRALESEFVYNQASAWATGIAQKTVPLSGLRAISIPLPPLAEQQRIVAKVDELMALCDELEVHLTTAATTRARLLDATLHETLNGAGDTAEAAMAD